MEKGESEKGLQPEVILKADIAAVSLAAAEVFVFEAMASVAVSGRFTVALSGGSTPRVLYRMLAEKPFSSRIPWDRAHVFWVDERCVPVDHFSSNFRAVKRALISRVPIPPENVHPMDGAIEPGEAARRYQEMLSNFFLLKAGEYPVFDLIYLGVGRDGHTASLFPGQPGLEEEEKPVLHVLGGDPCLHRITLTLPVLNRGKKIVFLVAGSGKAEVVRTIFEGKGKGLPAAEVSPVKGTLTWFLDLRAASLIPPPTPPQAVNLPRGA